MSILEHLMGCLQKVWVNMYAYIQVNVSFLQIPPSKLEIYFSKHKEGIARVNTNQDLFPINSLSQSSAA